VGTFLFRVDNRQRRIFRFAKLTYLPVTTIVTLVLLAGSVTWYNAECFHDAGSVGFLADGDPPCGETSIFNLTLGERRRFYRYKNTCVINI